MVNGKLTEMHFRALGFKYQDGKVQTGQSTLREDGQIVQEGTPTVSLVCTDKTCAEIYVDLMLTVENQPADIILRTHSMGSNNYQIVDTNMKFADGSSLPKSFRASQAEGGTNSQAEGAQTGSA